MLTLMVSFLLILSSCSARIETVTKTVYEKQMIPVEMLRVNCTVIKPDKTPRKLSAAYLSEKACRKAYVKLVENLIRDYTEEGINNDSTSGHRQQTQSTD